MEKYVDDPGAYWYDKYSVEPHLASFALNVSTVPAISDNLERVYRA